MRQLRCLFVYLSLTKLGSTTNRTGHCPVGDGIQDWDFNKGVGRSFWYQREGREKGGV